jgi:PIN domain nuclease of toxin-antitoxin system
VTVSPGARACIQNEANTIVVSVKAWEIGTKHPLSKFWLAGEAVAWFNELVELDAFQHLPATYLHALRAAAQAAEHLDPFDRMVAAQSEPEGLPLIPCDTAFTAFRVQALW